LKPIGYVDKTGQEQFSISKSVTSAPGEAIARVYNRGLRLPDSDVHITPEIMLNAFFLHGLLHDKHRLGLRLSVPHHGLNRVRLDKALSERNQRMTGTGQEMWAHACDLCMRHSRGEDGVQCELRALFTILYIDIQIDCLTAVVADGITVGHPCCGVHNCKIPLDSPKDRFCALHCNFNDKCAVVECTLPSAPEFRTCEHPEHREREMSRRTKGLEIFRLRILREQAKGHYQRGSEPTGVALLDKLEEQEEEHAKSLVHG
jgi:hypothetical protein